MKIGVPKEIKNNEFRVGLTPSSVAELVHHGHAVSVETGAACPMPNILPLVPRSWPMLKPLLPKI